MKPVCVLCNRFYYPSKNGRAVEEFMPAQSDTPAGQPEGWRTYKLWLGDEWTCRGCGSMIVVGFGTLPVSESFYPDHEDQLACEPDRVEVYDC